MSYSTVEKNKKDKKRNLLIAGGAGLATLGTIGYLRGSSGGGSSGGGSSGGGSSGGEVSSKGYSKEKEKGLAMLDALYNNNTYDIADKKDYNLMSSNLKRIFPINDNETISDYFYRSTENYIPDEGYTKILGKNITNEAANNIYKNTQTPYWKKQLEIFNLKGSDLRNPKLINYALKYSPQIVLAQEISKQVNPLNFTYSEDSNNYRELKRNLKNQKISKELANNSQSLGLITSPFTGVHEPITKEATKVYDSLENRVISTENALNVRERRNKLLKDPDLKNYLGAKYRISTDKINYNPNKLKSNLATLASVQRNPKIKEYEDLNRKYKDSLDKIRENKKIYKEKLNNLDNLVHTNLGIPNKKPITSLGKVLSLVGRAR